MRHNRRVLRRVVFALGGLASFALAPAAESAARHYWIGAVPVDWNIVPSGRDPISGALFNAEDTTMPTVVYKRFTRGWGQMLPDRFWTGDNDGIPGPTIRARVGDTVLVHFKNLDTRFNLNHSMHFHAFRYEFEDDGSFIPGASGRDAEVPPGGTALYRLVAVRGSAGVWPYHTHSSMMHHPQARTLYGMISIRGRKERRPNRENIVVFAEHQGFQTVNGRAFIGNTPTFRARVGDLVSWNVMALGSEFHTFHLHGHRWRALGQNIDTRNVGPAESWRFRITEDEPGSGMSHCHVIFHMDAGMVALYNVPGRAARPSPATGTAGAALTGRP